MKTIVKLRALVAAVGLACLIHGNAAVSSAHGAEVGPRFWEPYPRISVPRAAYASRSVAGSTPPAAVTPPSRQGAIDVLGAQIGAVARWYGTSEQALSAEILRDDSLKLDEQGRLYFAEPLEPAKPKDVKPASGGPRSASAPDQLWSPAAAITEGTIAPLDQSFSLHSRPGASKTIYLNFLGARLAGTAWNTPRKPVINARPFSFEGPQLEFDPSRNWKNPHVIQSYFSSSELQAIQQIWQIVSEDFATFDVDVTTEPVPPAMLDRSGLNDTAFGATVLFTDNIGTFDLRLAGAAYYSGFGIPYINTAVVFADMIAPDPTGLANVASHEAGHLLGLYHDGVYEGTRFNAYYEGHGSNPRFAYTLDDQWWAPIMGRSGYRSFKQWSKGEYPGAIVESSEMVSIYTRQDDVGEIQAYLGRRPDEVGDTISTAAPLSMTESNGVTSGKAIRLVNSAGDSDIYSVKVTRPGTLIAMAAPPGLRPNPDLDLTLLSQSGEVLANDSRRSSFQASVGYRITTPGTYYLKVNGAGLPAMPGNPGYSNYGSIGYFTLTASFGRSEGTAPVARLKVTPQNGVAPLRVTLDPSGSYDDGDISFIKRDFGDGEADVSGGLQPVTRTYSRPGDYAVSIKVTDDEGGTDTSVQFIRVTGAADPPPPSPPPSGALSAAIKLDLLAFNQGSSYASGTLLVQDDQGRAVQGAKVTYRWSGLVSGDRALDSFKKGNPVLSTLSSRTGCFELTVTGISLAGFSFDTTRPNSSKVCRQ